jgi:peptidoglycan/LPS O-acetylase OafA/YrhL
MDHPQRRNNIDLLRFILAATVLFFHVGILSGVPALHRVLRFANGRDAVLGFFVISGYVVSLSWQRIGSLRVYASHRLRRILPGYFAVVLLCWLAGAAVSVLPVADYWRNSETWCYLAANLAFLQFLGPSLPGVFVGNHVASVMNGSLWSIRTELFCYALVPLLSCIRWRAIALATACFAVLVVLPGGRAHPLADEFRIGIFEPVECFAIGAFFASESRRRRLFLPAMILLGASFTRLESGLLEPFTVAFLVLSIALVPVSLGRWSAAGNLSFGMYLWHFPIVQWLTTQHWAARSPRVFFLAAVALTLALAAMSWNLVERRFLAKRKDW